MKLNRILLIIPIVFAFFIYNSIFKVKSLNVQSEKIDCADDLQIKNSTNILGQNIFLINKNPIESDLKKKFICINQINLSKIFPSKINLRVLGREAKAKLYLASPSAEASSEAYLVDEEGVIFSKDVNNIFAPRVFFENTDLYLGKNIEFRNILKILNESGKFGLDIEVSQILDSFIVIFSLPKVIFKLDNQIDVQIASLQLILEKAKMDSETLDFIDLRFDKPVIRIAPKK